MTTSTDTLLILAAPPEILLGLAILLTVAGLVLLLLVLEEDIRKLPTTITRRLRDRRRWLFIPGAGQTLAQGECHD